MPEACIVSLYFSDASLSKIWCFGFNLQRQIRTRAHLWAMMILPSVWFFVSSTHIEWESISWRIIWYLLPRMDMRSSFPVWSVYMVCDMSCMVMKISCWRSSSLSYFSFSSSCYSVAGLVDLNPYRNKINLTLTHAQRQHCSWLRCLKNQTQAQRPC